MSNSAQLDALKIDRVETAHGGGRGRIVILVLIVIVVAAAVLLLRNKPVIDVQTTVVREAETGGSATVLNASGYVTARRKATVSSKVTGKVVEIFIEEGMVVEKNQVLARLDSANVQLALDLDEARVAASVADLEETKVRIDEALLDLKRVSRLVEQKVVSEADLDRAEAEVNSLKARLASQREQVIVVERQVALSRQYLDDLTIRAPFSGVIVSKDAQPGEMISPVSAGGGFTRTGIGTIVDMASLEIEVDVNESYINRVAAGQPVIATLDAYADWKIPASVIAIVPTADRQKATVRVRIGFVELDARILPDMGVKVAFQSPADNEVPRVMTLVAKAAIRDEGSAQVVFVVSGEVVERRALRLGAESGGEVVVLAGLVAGERVVLDPQPAIVDGVRVEVTK